MIDQYISSRFLQMIKKQYPSIEDMQVNNVICLMVDYLDNKGIIDMNDFLEFLESQLLAAKIRENIIQDDDDWKFK